MPHILENLLQEDRAAASNGPRVRLGGSPFVLFQFERVRISHFFSANFFRDGFSDASTAREILSKNDPAEELRDVSFYLCGPPAFSGEMEIALRGIGTQNVFYENWWAPPVH